jgi:CheY-like chemotaxis protein
MNSADILVVEDDGATRDLLRMSLELEGYTVSLASNGVEGWQRVRASPPCLVLLDIMMPEMDGGELLGLIRGDPELARLPVIVISAFGAMTSITSSRAEEYVPKPFDLDGLMTKIERYCGPPLAHVATVSAP